MNKQFDMAAAVHKGGAPRAGLRDKLGCPSICSSYSRCSQEFAQQAVPGICCSASAAVHAWALRLASRLVGQLLPQG